MTKATSLQEIRARIDVHGRIGSADEPVLRLQHAAGGEADGPLLVPQLAAISRLARRLRLLVSRSAVAACEGTTISMWVRAKPTAEGVDLLISDWRESIVQVPGQAGLARAADVASAAEGWSWQTNARLCFVESPEMQGEGEGRPEPGAAFTSIFRLDGDQGSGVLASIAQRRSFFDELVDSAHVEGRQYRISGHPLFGGAQEFVGYRGKAAMIAAQADGNVPDVPEGTNDPQIILPDFGKRLDLALRQPLGRIIANAETISGQMDGPLRLDYAGYAADIADAGRHLMELVDDLADLQAIDRPNFEVAREDIDLADIARRTAGLLALRAADRHVRIDAPPVGESMAATGEFRRALQIAVNLLGNAVRYSPENSIVWLRVSDDGGRAQLIVADQGSGIAGGDQERIFEKFERLGRKDTVGSGLGLYISRRLARAMGGDITLDSAPGQGARFILSLPKR